MPLKELYDEKQCHETFSFEYKERTHKVFRIRQGPIRVNFIYLNDKRIVLLKTWAKRKDKLTKGDEKTLQDIAIEVIDCIDEYPFEARELV